MQKLGGRVWVTQAEAQCYRLAQAYRRRHLWRQLFSLRSLFWPHFLDQLSWSDILWRRAGQCFLVLLLWPLLLLGGVLRFLGNGLMLPSRLMASVQVPRSLKSPGEKTLIGIHNAFTPVLDLEEPDYIRCINRWVGILFGEEVALERNLNVYLRLLKNQRQELREDTGGPCASMAARRDLVIARERLSQALGHYLHEQPVRGA